MWNKARSLGVNCCESNFQGTKNVTEKSAANDLVTETDQEVIIVLKCFFTLHLTTISFSPGGEGLDRGTEGEVPIHKVCGGWEAKMRGRDGEKMESGKEWPFVQVHRRGECGRRGEVWTDGQSNLDHRSHRSKSAFSIISCSFILLFSYSLPQPSRWNDKLRPQQPSDLHHPRVHGQQGLTLSITRQSVHNTFICTSVQLHPYMQLYWHIFHRRCSLG